MCVERVKATGPQPVSRRAFPPECRYGAAARASVGEGLGRTEVRRRTEAECRAPLRGASCSSGTSGDASSARHPALPRALTATAVRFSGRREQYRGSESGVERAFSDRALLGAGRSFASDRRSDGRRNPLACAAGVFRAPRAQRQSAPEPARVAQRGSLARPRARYSARSPARPGLCAREFSETRASRSGGARSLLIGALFRRVRRMGRACSRGGRRPPRCARAARDGAAERWRADLALAAGVASPRSHQLARASRIRSGLTGWSAT